MTMKRLIVGITGATGVIFGVRLLETLVDSGIETHLVVSKWAQQTLGHETTMTMAELNGLATVNYAPGDMGAAISSGSFHTDGMVIVPCSVRSLAAVAHGMGDHLVHRAADVVLKERRKLVLVARETPLNEIHLNNMLMLARMGAVILPPVPAFYNHPESLDDMVDHIVMRILDQFDMPKELMARWDGKLRSRASNTQ
jgi:4-hydroxy-3-polyprenylbenzoate decarboxylase